MINDKLQMIRETIQSLYDQGFHFIYAKYYQLSVRYRIQSGFFYKPKAKPKYISNPKRMFAFPLSKNSSSKPKESEQKKDRKSEFKLKYFQCRKGAQHEGQVLNYLCLQKSCKQNGLICSVCKHNHTGHNVVPLKYLLNSLRNIQVNPMLTQSFQTQLQQMQQLKNSFLYELKTITQKLAQKIEKIEEQIIQKYKRRKVELMNQIEMNMKFNEIIDSTLNNNLGDQETFEKDFKVIASLIESTDKSKDENPLHSKLFSFSVNLNQIVQDYQQNYISFSDKINHFLNDSQKTLNQLLESSPASGQQTTFKVQPSMPTESIGLGLEYKFNEKSKGSNIKLSSDLKTAECTLAGNQRFALIDGTVQKKGTSIRFKVEKVKNWVGLGLAIRSNIEGKKFQFIYNNLGHGSFLLSNNSYSWSHAFAANNIQNSSFTFVEGNIIKVEVTETELIYTNESQQNKMCKLPLALNQNEWKQACFCVNLCSVGDAATIL